MILVIDNYDSFTFNLVQYLGELGASLHVVRNDKLDADTFDRLAPEAILISPGPGTPDDAGVSLQIISERAKTIPTLGVCLGHQCIGQIFGGRILRAPNLMHGKTSQISHNDTGVFRGLSNPFVATRYHSLVVERDSLSPDVEICAVAEDDGTIMGLRHKTYPIYGVQFHPESILTVEGKRLLNNFLELAGSYPRS